MMATLPPPVNRLKTTGFGSSYGDAITRLLTTPTTLKELPNQVMVSPTGFVKPIKRTAASFNINADESLRKFLEKSRPSFICQPMVLP